MKQYAKYFTILIILSALFVASCDDWLEMAPTGEETKEFIFQDYLRTQRYIDALYANRIPTWFGGNRFGDSRGGLLESATDMAQYTASYGIANVSINIGNWYNSWAQSREINRWNNSYANIRRCYMFLENIDSFRNDPKEYFGPGTPDRKELMKGEVHFFIAWYYNELLKRYGGVPIIERTLSLEDDFRIPRATYDETLDFIMAHLDSAYTILPDEWDPIDLGRINRAMIHAFKSRLLLYAASPNNNPDNDQAKWLAAAEASRDYIEYIESSGLHSLEPTWQRIFMRHWPEEVPEIVMTDVRSTFAISFNSTIIRNNQATPGLPFQGYGSNTPTQNFVDRFEIIEFDGDGNATGTEMFDWDNPDHVENIYLNRDPRFYWSVLYNDVFWIARRIGTWRDGDEFGPDRDPKDHLYSRTGYYLRKFWPRECETYEQPGGAFLSSFYYRYTEAFLNYAEAMNELFGPDTDGLGRAETFTAREAVNIIRERVHAPPSDEVSSPSDRDYYAVYLERQSNSDFPVLPDGMPPIPAGLTQDEFRDRVRNERVIEFAFEDHYWYDVLRWRVAEEHIGGTIIGAEVIRDGAEFSITRRVIGERFFDPARMYRYPIPDIEVQVMGIEQNPNW